MKTPVYLAILATFKNETMTLRLWLEHHLWQGVEHFYLIDNESTDNPLSILQEYIDRGLVTYRYMPGRHRQVPHYHTMYDSEDIRRYTKWLIVCDLDEFVFGVHRPLSETLVQLEDKDVIMCNWFMYGTDSEHQPEDIRVSCTERAPGLHPLTKYIFQTDALRRTCHIKIHALQNTNGMSVATCNDLIRLHHYPLQSIEYFTKVKLNRGDAHQAVHDQTRNMDYFHSMNRDNHGCRDDLLQRLVTSGYPA